MLKEPKVAVISAILHGGVVLKESKVAVISAILEDLC